MEKYKIGDQVVIKRASGSLDEGTVVNVIKSLFRKRYIVRHTYRNVIEGMKTEYLEIKPKEIMCKKEEIN